MSELWLPVVGFEGLYEVSDLGQVKSLSREINGRWGVHKLQEHLMALSPNTNGYLQVNLSKAGKVFKRRVHNLVVEAFLGPCPEGHQVAHGPAGKKCNELTNLSYKTIHENQYDDKVRDGVLVNGEDHHWTKLTAEHVRLIRERHTAGEPIAVLAREFEVSHGCLSHIVHHRSWKHL